MGQYWRPRDLLAALEILRQSQPRILAGGTRLVRGATPADWDQDMLDITGIAALQGVTATAQGWRIGAATTWTALLDAPITALRQAASTVASPQVRHQATVGGNVVARFASADGVPALLALDADMELARAGSSRHLPLAQFLLGEALAPDELLVALHIPTAGRTGFAKHGSRHAVNVAEVTAAVRLDIAGGHVQRAALALGGCLEAAQRLPFLEATLVGRPADAALAGLVDADALAHLPLLDDFRAPAAYRQQVATTLLRRLLIALSEEAAA